VKQIESMRVDEAFPGTYTVSVSLQIVADGPAEAVSAVSDLLHGVTPEPSGPVAAVVNVYGEPLPNPFRGVVSRTSGPVTRFRPGLVGPDHD